MKIYCFIHYFGTKHSRSIFSELVDELLKYNLANHIAEYHLLLSGELKNGPSIKDLAFLRGKLYIHMPEPSYVCSCELDTLAIISKVSKQMNHTIACLYLHTKGASDDSCIQKAWRKYMLDFNIGCWENALHKLKTYHLFGVNWSYSNFSFDPSFPWSTSRLYGHFMGNFWWGRSDYLSSLPVPSFDWSSRYTAEAWVGLNEPRVFNIMRSPFPLPDHSFEPHQYNAYLKALRFPTVSVEVALTEFDSFKPNILKYDPTADRYRHDPSWDFIKFNEF